jgi:nucleotide-binding universal stress UspA family protein
MVRTFDRPIYITGPSDAPIRRVLAAADLSTAARPTLDMADRVADLFTARLRVVHAVEPVHVMPDFPVSIDEQELLRRTEEELERSVWPLVTRSDAERLVRHGPAAPTIASAVAEWSADLLVVGSHGRGWVDRVLIGSCTERLLNILPCAMLVVPVSSPVRAGPQMEKPRRLQRAGK